MHNLSWHLFAEKKSPGSFWAAAQLALQLESKGVAVNLYSDSPGSESWYKSIRAECLPEDSCSVKLFDISRAVFDAPAQNVVQVWGSQAPSAYLDRLGHLDQYRCFNLDSLCSSRVILAPFTPVTTSQACRELAVQMGDSPRQAGYLKHQTGVTRSNRLRDIYRDRLALLMGFDVPTAGQQSAYFVMMSGTTDFDPCPFVRMLRDTRRPSVLLVEPGDAQLALACAFDVPHEPCAHVQLDQLTLVFLPAMNWEEQDDCIALSDLVVSSEASLCWRACCLGTPLVIGFADRDQNALLEWYCQGSISSPNILLKNLSSKLLSYSVLAEAWHWYKSCLADFEDHAHEVQQRIIQGPDLVHYLMEAPSAIHVPIRSFNYEHE